MTLTNNTLKEYHFTDEQIDFILDIITNNAQFGDEELRNWMKELSKQIEDQIVNHMENEWHQLNNFMMNFWKGI